MRNISIVDSSIATSTGEIPLGKNLQAAARDMETTRDQYAKL